MGNKPKQLVAIKRQRYGSDGAATRQQRMASKINCTRLHLNALERPAGCWMAWPVARWVDASWFCCACVWVNYVCMRASSYSFSCYAAGARLLRLAFYLILVNKNICMRVGARFPLTYVCASMYLCVYVLFKEKKSLEFFFKNAALSLYIICCCFLILIHIFIMLLFRSWGANLIFYLFFVIFLCFFSTLVCLLSFWVIFCSPLRLHNEIFQRFTRSFTHFNVLIFFIVFHYFLLLFNFFVNFFLFFEFFLSVQNLLLVLFNFCFYFSLIFLYMNVPFGLLSVAFHINFLLILHSLFFMVIFFYFLHLIFHSHIVCLHHFHFNFISN